ncbi:MAG: SDR family NAD(P)-dependent oxidoreductase, partial [Myxococcota bacterium]
MSLYARFQRPGPSGFGYGSTTDEVCRGLDLKGRRIVLTGSNSGLGLETLRVLTHHGATVLAAARTKAKAEDACAGFGENAVPVVCELSDPASVRSCVEDVSGRGGVDAIICNAGIMALPKLEQCFGIEKQFFTNHVGHFML